AMMHGLRVRWTERTTIMTSRIHFLPNTNGTIPIYKIYKNLNHFPLANLHREPDEDIFLAAHGLGIFFDEIRKFITAYIFFKTKFDIKELHQILIQFSLIFDPKSSQKPDFPQINQIL